MVKKTWTLTFAKNWRGIPPPVRPEPQLLKVLDRYIARKLAERGKNVRILVLGSTPEFRDLASKRGLTPTVIDYSRDNYKALTLLKKYKGKERYYQQDWTKLRLPGQYDIILAEASLTVVPKNAEAKVLQRIQSLLAPGGYFLSKSWVLRTDRLTSLGEIIRDYRKHYRVVPMARASLGPLYSYYFDRKCLSLSLRHLSEELRKEHARGVLNDREWASIERLGYEQIPLELYLPRQKVLVASLKKYFKLEAVIKSGYSHSEYFPLFVLRPKSMSSTSSH